MEACIFRKHNRGRFLFTLIFPFLWLFTFFTNVERCEGAYDFSISGIQPTYVNLSPYAYEKRDTVYKDALRRSILVAHAPSELSYKLPGQAKYFKTEIGILSFNHEHDAGLAKVNIFLDGQLAFSTEVFGGRPPQKVLIDISGHHDMVFYFDDLGSPDNDHSALIDPEFTNFKTAGWDLAKSPSRLELQPNRRWDAGNRDFPNKTGLLAWNVIVAGIYLLIVVGVILKRDSIVARLSIWRTKEWRYIFTHERLIMLCTAIICLIVIAPIFRSGIPAAWDSGQHYFRCVLMKNLFLSNFKVDGWSPYWYQGVQQFLFYSPFLFVLIVILHFLTFQLVPLVVCFKIAYLLVYLLLPFSCYWLLCRIGVNRTAAALACMAVPAFSAIHGIGLESLFGSGLLTQALGLNLFCLILGHAHKISQDNEITYFDVVCLGTILGITLISHIITTVYMGLFFILLLLANIGRPKRIIAFLLAFVLSGMISGAVVWSTFLFRSLQGPSVGWGSFNFFAEILKGKYFGPSLFNVFCLLGIGAIFLQVKRGWFRVTADRFKVILFLMTIITFFLAGGKYDVHIPALDKLFPDQIFKHRIYPYLAIFFIIYAGYFFQFIMALLQKWNRRSLVTIAMVIVVLSCTLPKLFQLGKLVKLDTDYQSIRRDSLLSAMSWLKNNTPENSIITFDDRSIGLDSVGFNQLASQINFRADRYTLQGNQMELTNVHNEGIAGELAMLPPETIHQKLIRYNVSYVYSWLGDTVDNLSSRPDLFSPVFNNGIVTIFQIANHEFRYLGGVGMRIDKFAFSPELIEWTVHNERVDNLLIAAVAYSPKWHIFIDGVESKLTPTDDHLISFSLPNKERSYKVRLVFRKTTSELFFGLISIITIPTVILILLNMKFVFSRKARALLQRTL